MNRIIYFFLLFILPYITSFAQTDEYNVITDAGNGLYFMYFDSSAAKSTIVEFEDFLVLIEAPIKNEGGGARNLKDHTEGGKKILRTLSHHFPTKPLKYLMHSHWHPHSISSVNPFLRSNVKIVTTDSNFSVIKAFVDTTSIPNYKDNIVFVSDSLEVSDGKTKLTAYHLKQSDYPNIPTKDYLYFYLHSHNIIHCACMYTKWEGEPVEGKEILSGRQEDLYKFLQSKNLKPEFLIRYNKETKQENDMQPHSGLENVINNGIRSVDITKRLLEITQSKLDDSLDAVTADIISRNIPASIINTTVYTLLRRKELKKANSFAKIQAMMNPSDPNSWDTLGETFYFLGDITMAEHYGRQSKKVSPTYTTGGMEVWKEDLNTYQKIWENIK